MPKHWVFLSFLIYFLILLAVGLPDPVLDQLNTRQQALLFEIAEFLPSQRWKMFSGASTQTRELIVIPFDAAGQATEPITIRKFLNLPAHESIWIRRGAMRLRHALLTARSRSIEQQKEEGWTQFRFITLLDFICFKNQPQFKNRKLLLFELRNHHDQFGPLQEITCK